MMSLSSTIKAGAQASADYYLKEETDLSLGDEKLVVEKGKDGAVDYYLSDKGNATQHTQWFGKLAEKYDLLGKEVTRDEFVHFFEGQIGGDSVKGAGNSTRRQAYDLTFSAPKGASIMALTYGDERVSKAWEDSVKQVLSEIEKDTAQTRTFNADKATNEYTNTGNLAFALIRHQTSRDNDPQLHFHAIMGNMTENADGKLQSLATCFKQSGVEINGVYERIMANQKYYTAMVHSYFGERLQDNGYAIKHLGKGMIDIDGIPTDVVESNSNRSQEIDEYIDKVGFDSPKSRDIAAQATRKPKDDQEFGTLNEKWRNRDNAHGFDGIQFVKESYQKAADLSAPIETAKGSENEANAIALALSHISRSKTQFSMEKLVSLAMTEFNSGHALSISSVKQHVDYLLEKGELLALNHDETVFSSKLAISKEESLIESTKGRAKGLAVEMNQKAADQLRLPNELKSSIGEILGSKKITNIVDMDSNPYQFSQSLLHVAENSSLNVKFISPDLLLKQENKKNVARQSLNMLQWFKNLNRETEVQTVNGFLQNENTVNNAKTLLVVEHANLLDTDQVKGLISKAASQSNKIVFLNQTNSGKAFSNTDTMSLLKKGNVNEVQWRDSRVNETSVEVREVESKGKTQRITNDYMSLSQEERDRVVILAGSNKESQEINQSIRNTLSANGELGFTSLDTSAIRSIYLDEEQKTQAKNYKVGAVLTEFVGKRANSFYIESVDVKTNRVTLRQGDIKKTYSAMELAEKRVSLSEEFDIELSVGDKIRTFAPVFSTDIQGNENLRVTKLSRDELILTNSDTGNVYELNPRVLNGAAIDYSYATSQRRQDFNRQEVWASMNQYSGSKERVEAMIARNPEKLRFYTDNADKLVKNAQESKVQPTSIERVMGSRDSSDKYINARSLDVIKEDLTNVIGELVTDQNRPVSERAVEFAVGLLSEREAAFTHKELVKSAIEYSLSQFQERLDVGDFNQRLAALEEKGALLSTEYKDDVRWVTMESLKQEQNILAAIERGKGQVAPLVSDKNAQSYLDFTGLKEGQREAVRLIATTSDRFVGVQGFAGTGKSTMLEIGIDLVNTTRGLVDSLNREPVRFIGMAPTHSAVAELQEKGVDALTAQKVLYDYHAQGVNPEYKNSVFILDETSMASNEQLAEFVEMVEATEGARMVWLGDVGQIQSIKAGKPFQLAIERGVLATAYMKEIVRQKSKSVLEAVKHLINREGRDAINLLREQKPIDDKVYSGTIPTELTQLIPQEKQSILKSETVVETASPLVEAGIEYLSRTKEARDNTIVILYSNKQRDDFAQLIRPQLHAYGELQGNDVDVMRLRSLQEEAVNMKAIHSYANAQVYSVVDDYFNIKDVNLDARTVLLENAKTGEQRVMFPEYEDHKYAQLWEQTEQSIAQGESIVWRVTDKNRGITGNEQFDVLAINEQGSMQLVSRKTGNELTLDTKDLENQHWDYAYSKTANLAQGATYSYGITVPLPKSPLTDYRRAYIDASRAVYNLHVFTTDVGKLVEKWEKNDTDKLSALDVMEHKDRVNTKHFVPDHVNDTRFHVNGQFNTKVYNHYVADELSRYTESMVRKELGQENKSQSNKDYLVYGRKDEPQTKVTLTGEYRGFYRNFATGTRGNMVNFLMDHRDIDFGEAIKLGQAMLDNPSLFGLEATPSHEELKAQLPIERAKQQAWAEQYGKESTSIAGTLGERFIESIGGDVDKLDQTNVRFHNEVYSSDDKKVHPAVIARYTDKQGEFGGIEIFYLNEQGALDDKLAVNPRNLGEKTHNVITISESSENATTFLIGNTELAVSMAAELDNSNVYSVSVNTDLRNIDVSRFEGDVFIVVDSINYEADPTFIDELTHKFDGKAEVIDTLGLDSAEIANALQSIESDIVTDIEKSLDTLEPLDTAMDIPDLEQSDLEKSLDIAEEDQSTDILDAADEIDHEIEEGQQLDFDQLDADIDKAVEIEREAKEHDLGHDMEDEYQRNLFEDLEL